MDRPEAAQYGPPIGDLMRGERAMDKSVALGEEGEQGETGERLRPLTSPPAAGEASLDVTAALTLIRTSDGGW
jgi:hypothetical protein